MPRAYPVVDSNSDSNTDGLTATAADEHGCQVGGVSLVETAADGRGRAIAVYETAALPLSYTGVPLMSIGTRALHAQLARLRSYRSR